MPSPWQRVRQLSWAPTNVFRAQETPTLATRSTLPFLSGFSQHKNPIDLTSVAPTTLTAPQDDGDDFLAGDGCSLPSTSVHSAEGSPAQSVKHEVFECGGPSSLLSMVEDTDSMKGESVISEDISARPKDDCQATTSAPCPLEESCSFLSAALEYAEDLCKAEENEASFLSVEGRSDESLGNKNEERSLFDVSESGHEDLADSPLIGHTVDIWESAPLEDFEIPDFLKAVPTPSGSPERVPACHIAEHDSSGKGTATCEFISPDRCTCSPQYASPAVSEEADAQEFLSALRSLNSQSDPIENRGSEQATEQCIKPALQDDFGSSKQDDNECEEFASIMRTICHPQEFEAKGMENDRDSKEVHNGFQHGDLSRCNNDSQWTLATISASAQEMERQITVETAKSSTESSVALDEAVANQNSELGGVSNPHILVPPATVHCSAESLPMECCDNNIDSAFHSSLSAQQTPSDRMCKLQEHLRQLRQQNQGLSRISRERSLVDGLPQNTPVRSRLPSPRPEHMTPSPFSETISACIEEVERRNEFLLFLSSQSRTFQKAQPLDQHQVPGRHAGSDRMPHVRQTNGIEEFRDYASKQNPSLQRKGIADGTAGDEIVTLRKELHALRDRCLCWQAFQKTAAPL